MNSDGNWSMLTKIEDNKTEKIAFVIDLFDEIYTENFLTLE